MLFSSSSEPPSPPAPISALVAAAISNIFGSEDAIWEELASQAMGGSIKAMEMLLTYQYGKAGENKEVQQSTSKAPIIQFNVSKPEETIDTIDLTEEE